MAFGSILNQAPEGAVPKGCILLWSGQADAIPNGWALCDGNNSTPNLLNRFVVGAGDKYGVSVTGGEETHKLTISEMPAHSHTWTYQNNWSGNRFGGTSGVQAVPENTSTTGGDKPHNNMPPYYALCYIMKL